MQPPTKFASAVIQRVEYRPDLDHSYIGSVIDSAGNPIQEALLYRNRPDGTRHVLQRVRTISSTKRSLDSGVFGGLLRRHFGHFILESLCRLYSYRSSDLPIYFQSLQGSLEDWQVDMFRSLNIDIERIGLLTEDVVVDELTVASPGFLIPNFILSEQLEALRTSTVSPSVNPQSLWLSRSKLKGRYVEGEELLEAKLKELGWRIISPETLPIAEQIAMWSSADRLAGFAGSGFHTALLVDGHLPRISLFHRPSGLTRNFQTIAERKGLDQELIRLRAEEFVESELGGSAPLGRLTVAGMETIIERLHSNEMA